MHVPQCGFVAARVWGTVLGIGCGEWGGEGKRRGIEEEGVES